MYLCPIIIITHYIYSKTNKIMSDEKIKIDFAKVGKTLLNKKKLFLKVWIITFILSCLWIFPKPRYYKCEISIAPETSSSSVGSSSLLSLASNFGFNMGNLASSDAIYPQLYPELLKSTNFLVELLDIKVKTKDGKVNTDYYTYMVGHQKVCIWDYPKNYILALIEQWTSKDDKIGKPNGNGKRFDPFRLDRKTSKVLEAIEGNITTTYSKKTDVVSLTVEDQDPLVCALLADSIMSRLQQYIINYRTQKARIDYEHYKNLTATAKRNYELARNKYASFADANEDVVLQSVKSKEEDLENDMQLKYNIYTAMNTRLEAAMAKVQETTPVFTTLQNATVPIKPAGPKRVLFVIGMLFLATLGTIVYIYRKEMTKEYTQAQGE